MKEAAEGQGEGSPVAFHSSHEVVDVNPDTATITFAGGEKIQGDAVIGADSTHPVIRENISDTDSGASKIPLNSFRFMLNRKQAHCITGAEDLFNTPGQINIWLHSNRVLTGHPSAGKDELTFVGIYSHDVNIFKDSIDKKAALVKLYECFDGQILDLIKSAETESIVSEPLAEFDCPSKLVNNRLAVVGDAACHPLYAQTFDIAFAIEDAACLAAVLSRDIKANEVSQRLNLYQRSRQERLSKIIELTRQWAHDGFSLDQGTLPHYSSNPSARSLTFLKLQISYSKFLIMMNGTIRLILSAKTLGPLTQKFTIANQ